MMSTIEKMSDYQLKDYLKRQNEHRCGSCSHWMIKSQCPRELKHKVHMNEFPCNLWEESYLTMLAREEAETELIIRNL